MWNPFYDIHKDWTSCVSRWGYAKVLMFYTYCWISIGFNGYRIYEPVSFGYSCLLNGSDGNLNSTSTDASITSINEWNITMLMRQWSVFICAYNIVLVQSKSRLQSLQMMFITGVASLAILWVNMENTPDTTCFSRINATWPLTVGWPFLTLICGYIEDRILHDNTNEESGNSNNTDSDTDDSRRDAADEHSPTTAHGSNQKKKKKQQQRRSLFHKKKGGRNNTTDDADGQQDSASVDTAV